MVSYFDDFRAALRILTIGVLKEKKRMKFQFASVLLVLLAVFGAAYRLPKVNALKNKVAQGFVASSLVFGGFNALDTAFMEGAHTSSVAAQKSVFIGNYDDPEHPGCLRKITVQGKNVKLIGSDDINGANQWVLSAKEDFPGTIFVDFSPKGGPSDLLGVFNEQTNGIKWPDGNTWKKLSE